MLFQIRWILGKCMGNPTLQSWKLCWWWSMMDIESSRPLCSNYCQPIFVQGYIGLRKLKIQSTSIASTPTFVYPPHPLPCWWDWDIMWSFLFVSLNSTMISSTIQTAKKLIIGRPPKNNNPTLDFRGVDSDTWWTWWVQMTRRNFGTKWKRCKQPIDLQKTTRNYIWKIEIKNCHNDVWIHDVMFFLAPWHLTSHYDQTNCK